VSTGRIVAQDEKNSRAEMVTLIPALALSATSCLNLNPTTRAVDLKGLITSKIVSPGPLCAPSDPPQRTVRCANV